MTLEVMESEEMPNKTGVTILALYLLDCFEVIHQYPMQAAPLGAAN